MRVGIEAISFHGVNNYINLADLANARGIDPNKFTKGLGQVKMAVATPLEDPVYLAINAGLKVLKDFNVDPSEIGTLVVGTESGVDHSKPVAAYVHEALGLRQNCHTYETKHACFGAMAAVSSARDWISCGRANGAKALIIASDIARYPKGSPGEPTQGAGAIAMIISDKPNLVYFDEEVTGNYTKQVMDFWRPLYSKEAIVDGHYSLECYLDALKGAINDAMSKTKVPDFFELEQLQACLYHVPFCKMAMKAHHRHFEVDANETIDKESERYKDVFDSYNKKVSPWLSLNSIVGNIYTGSVFLSLIDLLRQSHSSTLKQISLFGYGSGCASSFGVLYASPGFEKFSDIIDPMTDLDKRKCISIKEYEEIFYLHSSFEKENTEVLSPKDWGLEGKYFYLGTKDHRRVYDGL